MFALVGAHLGRQFEFVHSQWINDGVTALPFLGGWCASAQRRWAITKDGKD